MTSRRDTATADLFRDYAPPPVVERFAPDQVRAARCQARVKQAMSRAMKDCGKSREQLADALTEYLGESITRGVLDQYSSPANEGANIPAYRLVALFVITGDLRLLNALLADTGAVVIDARYEPLIRREMLKEAGERITRDINAADAQWRANR